ncbi:sister chromatid cohesion protein PDS5 homolog C-like isoform X2 [Rhododendron vialii]|uniref:sister chromatid cohesion protein PDS5 homolog C-like isoform X2 n=1 Tax=Rhododendron vialii TaxID=182163 RepID=UPI00265F0BA7|nr:sister chromatid cohesion protein PDS5 homolog C-like isoform X2 [Rhododendron vialii]
MGSLEEQLVAAGNSLLQPPCSVDELLLLLDQVENRLTRVEQSPSKSMQTALAPCKKALVANELLRHPDADVKVAVASCISEITRITAPDAPYEDDQMKDVFQLIVSSFENLSDKSSRSYHKRTLILETVANVRSCVVMLDLECDGLIIEMFQHFLKAIRDYHPEIVFSSMETIMTLVLEESEDISFELISPILASVKKDNQEVLPIARKLGKRVFEKCSMKLKPCLVQAKKCLGFSLDDYSKIISSICDGTAAAVGRRDDNACGEQMAEESKLCTASPEGAPQADEKKLAEASSNDAAQDQVNEESVTETRPEDCCEDSSPKSVMSNGLAEPGNEDRLADPESSKRPEHAQQADHSIDAQPDYSDSGKILKSQSKVKITSKKRRRKLNSSVKSSEPSDRVDSDKDAERTEDRPPDEPSVGVAVPSENEKENIQLSSPKALAGEAVNVASPLPSGGISDGGRPKKAGRGKKKENFIQEVSLSTDVSKKSSEVAIDTEVKPHKRSRKKARVGGTSGEKTPTLAETFTSEDGTASDSEAKPLKQLGRKVVRDSIGDGLSSKKEDGKRHGRDKATSEKDVTKAATKDGAKEVVSSPKTASKLAKGEGLPKALSKRKRTAGKGRSLDAMEYGANLVGAKVKVWWPDDEMFYEGVITSFYSDEKKHTVSYTDNDVEVLNLRDEKWEFRSDLMPDGEQATECHSPSPEM